MTDDERDFIAEGGQQLLELGKDFGVVSEQGMVRDELFINLLVMIVISYIDTFAEDDLESHQRLLDVATDVLVGKQKRH